MPPGGRRPEDGPARARRSGPAPARGFGPLAALRGRNGHPDFDGDPDYAPMWAGESCGVIHEVKPAAAIVHDLAKEAEAALAEAPEPG
jgi:hypothetical protein